MKPCCEEPANRRPGLGPRGEMGGFRDGPEVTYCVICSCRHIELAADSGKFGIAGKAL